MIARMVIILLAYLVVLAKAQDLGNCTLPSVDVEKDCPAKGVYCNQSTSVLGNFSTRVMGNVVTLKCNTFSVSLFVNGSLVPMGLQCLKSSGQWTALRTPPTQTALCAKQCRNCQTIVPTYYSGASNPIMTLLPSSNNPCTIGYCNGQGLTLTGMNNANDATAIAGNLTCAGNGWMDSSGNMYTNAVCQYYACSAPQRVRQPILPGAVSAQSMGPVLSCMPGYLLFYGAIRRPTRYNLVCGPNGLWQYFGIDIDASDMVTVFCAPALRTCSIPIATPPDCTADTCTAPGQLGVTIANAISTTFLYCSNPDYILDGTPTVASTEPIEGEVMCSGNLLTSTTDGDLNNVACRKLDTCTPSNVTDLSPTICAQNPSQCSPVVASASSLTCPPGQTLVAEVDNKVYVMNANLTCSGNNEYVDTFDRFATSYAVTKATCTSDPNLACRVPPSVLAPDALLFEYPPGATTTPVTLVAAVFFGSTAHALMLTTLTQSSVIYYNDDFGKIVDTLTCINGKYQTTDGTAVTSAASFTFVNCAVPTKAPGSTDVDQTTSGDGYYSCPSTVIYALDAASPAQTIGIAGITNYVVCGPNKQYVLHDSSGSPFLVPAGTLIGCT